MSAPRDEEHLHADVRFFFVTGAHKSGTNWVGAMLRGHPEVFLAGEAWFVGFGCSAETWINREKFDKWCGIPTVKSRWTKDLDLDRVRLDVQRMMIEAVMRQRWKPGIRAIGDRTPLFYLRDAELLHGMFPEAVLINVVRDGRDVAVSHHFQMLRNEEWRFYEDVEDGRRARRYYIDNEGEPQPLFTDHTLRDVAGKWLRCVEGARRARALYGDRFIEFRYEELKQDPTVASPGRNDLSPQRRHRECRPSRERVQRFFSTAVIAQQTFPVGTGAGNRGRGRRRTGRYVHRWRFRKVGPDVFESRRRICCCRKRPLR